MKNITEKILKKETNTLVKYGRKNGESRGETETTTATTTGGTDTTNTTLTTITSSGIIFGGLRH